MPLRRPSASTVGNLASSAASSSTRVHRSNDSYQAFNGQANPSHSILTSSSSPTPQQKIVQVLVNRLKSKLPCNSGLSLDVLESDKATHHAVEALVELAHHDSLDLIAWALSELLERLAKPSEVNGHWTVETLQSQLFILKVMSVAMASRWNQNLRSSSRASNRMASDAHSLSGSTKKSIRPPSEYSSTPVQWSEPPPLDDNCARYILSVMVLFLRQTTYSEFRLMPSNRTAGNSYHGFESLELSTPAPSTGEPNDAEESPTIVFPEALRSQLWNRPSSSSINSGKASLLSTIPIPTNHLSYEKTPVTLIKATVSLQPLIAKFAGLIVYHLSASNWSVVFHRLRQKIHYLASTSEDNPDIVDLTLMSYSALDRTRLVQVLNELSSLLVNMRRGTQVAIAQPLRNAIWNWIHLFPGEYIDVIRSKSRMEGSPERVFDLLHSINVNHPGTEGVLWPILIALHCITSDRITSDLQLDHFGYANAGVQRNATRKEYRIVEEVIRYANTASKLSDTALICTLDICRAAALIPPEGELPLRLIGNEIAHEIKSALWAAHNQKPFWDSGDEIDVSLYSEALITIFQLLPDDESLPLFTACLEPERSEVVKIAAVKACLTLALESPQFSWWKSLDGLEVAVGHRLRSIFKNAALRRNEQDQFGNVKKAAIRPKAKRTTCEPLSDREALLLGILSLWQTRLSFFLQNLQSTEVDEWITAITRLWETTVDISIKIATASAFRLVAELSFKMRPTDNFYDVIISWMKKAMSATLISVVTNLIHARTDLEAQRLWITTSLQILELYGRKVELEHVREIQFAAGRRHAFILAEIAFVVSLTSADSGVSQMAARGLRILAQTDRVTEDVPNLATDEEREERSSVFELLGDPHVMVVGRVGHQKRIRRLVRPIARPTAVDIAIWEECFWRWRLVSEVLIESSPSYVEEANGRFPLSLSLEDTHFQWRNLTLFLAAYSGACALDEQAVPSLTSVVPAQYLPDQMRGLQHPASLASTFISYLTNLLVSDTVEIRDVSRDALGYELSSSLYSRLLKHLDQVILDIAEGASSELTESYAQFLDQFVALLKLLMEKAQAPLSEELSDDISSTLFALASFITRFNGPTCHRIKTKFCVLCDNVCEKTVSLTLRKDGGGRNDILDILMEWIQDLGNLSEGDMRIQEDLNMSCLRTTVKLLDRLQLRSMDDPNEEESRHGVSRLFVRYSGILLRCLDALQLETLSDSASDPSSAQQKLRATNREDELRDLVVTGLSFLVSANPQSGIKQCLPLAYDVDTQKRIIFAQVFARVLELGTVFNSQHNSARAARQNRLRELVKAPDMVLPMAICETCPAAEVDVMVSVLLNLFDTRTSLMTLLKLMIDREISHTENEAALFRSNTTCTKFLSAFAKIHGYNYLRSLIIPLIKTMSSMPSGHGYGLDPTKASAQDVEVNRLNVELVASSFLEIVSSSIPALPPMFREISSHIAKSVNAVWPESKFAALGAFIFLRFISPAVVAPEIVDVEIPKDDSTVIRRGLMVIAKVIQNLANNIFFGKEAHMVVLNKFLEDNIVNVTRFLSEIIKYSPSLDDEDDEWLGTAPDDTDTVVLHRFFDKHADRIGKELLSYSRPSPDGDDDQPISGKHAWDALCALLVDMGNPVGVPQLSSSNCSEHQGYIELMSRYAHRNTDCVRNLFVTTSTPQDRPAVFALHLSKIDVEALDVDMLMFYIFKILTLPAYVDRSYEIILDCTSFATGSEVPVQWLKFCTEMIPADIRKRLVTTHIVNPNSLTQRYLRRLHNISAGVPFSGEIRAYSSVAELAEHVPPEAITPLVYATNLEQEQCQVFKDVTMRQDHQMRMPVVLEVGSTHLRITSVKAQLISPTLSCRSTEIISLTDVSDVYNVSTGHDPCEFIIRRSRQGITLYFSSPDREAIIKTIRAANGKLKQARTSITEQFPRYSNVPATLMHIGMLNVDSADEELRRASFDLLRAVCSHLEFDRNPIVASQASFVPCDPAAFVTSLSEQLAEFVPELTIDFISEASAGMELVTDNADDKNFTKANTAQRINCLQYLSPWIKNLALFANPTSQYYEHSGAKLRDCVRVLSDLTIADAEIFTTIQKCIWSEIGKLDSTVVNIVLDELIRGAIDGGIGSPRCETIARVISALSSISVRGRLLSKLRRTLGKTSMKPSRTLADNIHWNEIATLTRLVLVAGNPSKQLSHHQFYVPEVVHLVALLAGTGQTLVRKSVYGIVMNLLQSLYVSSTDDPSAPELLVLINECSRADTVQLFGLCRTTATSEYTNLDPSSEKLHIDRQESLTQLLIRIMNVTAGTRGLLNVWRARWMSLVTSTAFQLSAAIQPRAFIAIGHLASSDVDDDLLYQMLVALKTALSQSSETNTMSVVSMLRCICKVMPALVENSRYICQVFWLAVALLQSSHIAFYVEATNLLRVTLDHMEAQGMFTGLAHEFLLDGRTPLEDIACQLDQLLGLSFDSSFSFSMASIIFKGLRHSGLKEAAEAALRSLLRVAVGSGIGTNWIADEPREVLHPDALGYFVALLPLSTSLLTYRRLLEECGVANAYATEMTSNDDDSVPRVSLDFLGINDATTALLLTSFIGAILTTAQGDDAETEILYNLLSDVALVFPDTVSMAYEGLQDRIKDTFANSSNASIISAVSNIFRVSLQDPGRQTSLRGSSSTIGIVDEVASTHGPGRRHLMALEDLGMQGLASSFQFLPVNRGHATKMINWIPELVIRIIE